MFQEGGPSPEAIQAELETELEPHRLAERVRSVPDPSDLLQERVNESFVSYLGDKQLTDQANLWLLYKDNRLHVLDKVRFTKGDDVELAGTDGTETVKVPKQRILEIEQLRTRLMHELRPHVQAELRDAPFVATRGPIPRGVQRCMECHKFVSPTWRMVVKNSKEQPLDLNLIGPNWSAGIADGNIAIPQEHRFISYLELHELEEHPSLNRLDIEDWKAFLGADEGAIQG